MRHLIKLAKTASSFEAFTREALAWPKWYGFPGRGTSDDYRTFYNIFRKGE